MERLSYQTLDELGYTGYLLREAPERVLQFGDGAFLRAFVDYFVDLANERAGFDGKVCVVQPRAKTPERADALNAQDGLYTVVVQGLVEGAAYEEARVVSAVSRCLNPHRSADWQAVLELAAQPQLAYVVSNTTDAGLIYDATCAFDDAPQATYPAKLTRVLWERYAAGLGGLQVLPCEFVPKNGEVLRELVGMHAADWELEPGFTTWLDQECVFRSTLVDRIVSGKPADASQLEAALGYRDAFLDVCEPFALWAVEQDPSDPLPFGADEAGLAAEVQAVPDVSAAERRKVRLLNATHTSMAPLAWLAGIQTVAEALDNGAFGAFIASLLKRELPVGLDGDAQANAAFAASVVERFGNPYLAHQLEAICLNSVSKWRGRCLPALTSYIDEKHALPVGVVAGLAGLLALYAGGVEEPVDGVMMCARPDGTTYTLRDDQAALEFFWDLRGVGAPELAASALAAAPLWGADLSQIEGLVDAVAGALEVIERDGASALAVSAAEPGA